MFKIVIVENENLERSVLKNILSEGIDETASIYEAKNSNEALEILNKDSIDMMIIDEIIPDIRADEIIKYTKKKFSKVSIILTTVHDEVSISKMAINLKIDEYLLKPIRPQRLLEAVKSHMASSVHHNASEDLMCSTHLEKLAKEINFRSYKNSIICVKDFVSTIFKYKNKPYFIADKILSYSNGIIRIGDSICKNLGIKLKQQSEPLKNTTDIYAKRYDICTILINMIDTIFNEISIQYSSSGNDMKKVINYIDMNIKKGITLKKAADYANMSSFYFSKVFKKTMNMNFITYITNMKMDLAKEMLINTDMPVINIAYTLSYNEANYFSKAFKKNVGITPSEFRAKYSNFFTKDK